MPRVMPRRTPLAVFVVTVVAAGAGAMAARAAYLDNEDRLLDQRVDEAAAVLEGSLPAITSPLVGAAELAEVTDGGSESFERVLGGLVGPEASFRSASIWPVGETEPSVVLGAAPRLASQSPEVITDFLERSTETDLVAVVALLEGPAPALGYSFTSPTRTPEFVVYAESPLPEDRTSVPREDSAFRELDYALYLGDEREADALLAASRADLPLPEPTASAVVPFGDRSIFLVMHPTETLAGAQSETLPWLVAAGGVLLGLALALLTQRLVRRREEAERLAEENGRLYAEQRSLAHAVQHTLLPADLPGRSDVEIGVHYAPGVDGIDVGGDWYDVVTLTDGRLLVVVGDVAGRGLRAATVMALLRHATRAHVADGDRAAEILPKLTRLLHLEGESAFATVLCLELDFEALRVTVINAGHPRALLIGDDGARFVDTPVGPPVGVPAPQPYPAVTMDLPVSGTLLAFTDGLFERRGETVDDGMARVRAAADGSRPLDQLIVEVVDELTGGSADDDIAVVGLRWPLPGTGPTAEVVVGDDG